MARRKARTKTKAKAKTKAKSKAKVKAKVNAKSKKARPKQAPNGSLAAGRLIPPEDGMVVRMYRIGHGDCFLLAFPGEPNTPVYVLIDCGYKPGSPKFINTTAKEVCRSIREATGGHIHVAVITHEHQDHVNGITAANFKDFTIGQAWFAWTEDGDDKLANKLRRRFKDRLVTLMGIRNHLAAVDGDVKKIDDFLAFELGGEDERFDPASAQAVLGVAGRATGESQNKRAMKLLRTLAGEKNCRFLRPHEKAVKINGVEDLRVYALGPPRDEELLHSLDPAGDESFRSFGFGATANYFAAAVESAKGNGSAGAPFAERYCMAWDKALKNRSGDFWQRHYWAGRRPARESLVETQSGEEWRRIDKDWLGSGEQLALDMNNDTNNGSLVLAFELNPRGKVLLFASDAQRGNWVSWGDGTWKDGERTVELKDLLGRTVLYKVGHHGSHNATLKGGEHANLGWMAKDDYAAEFTAMITAVRSWAETQKGWDHPQKEIKDALLAKTKGRVFQTDTDVTNMRALGSPAEWDAFMSRIKSERLFIDYTIKY